MRKKKLEELKKYVDEIKWVKNEIIEKNNDFIKIVSRRFYLNNSICIDREQILKNGKDGSAVIIVPKIKNELLVTIEPRVFTKMKIAVSFPAGYIEACELPIDAAIRELKEETGCIPTNIKEIDSFYQDEGISAAYNHLFFADDCVQLFNQNLDKDEVIKLMTFTYNELLELERMGYISGSNSKLALCRVKKYIK